MHAGRRREELARQRGLSAIFMQIYRQSWRFAGMRAHRGGPNNHQTTNPSSVQTAPPKGRGKIFEKSLSVFGGGGKYSLGGGIGNETAPRQRACLRLVLAQRTVFCYLQGHHVSMREGVFALRCKKITEKSNTDHLTITNN